MFIKLLFDSRENKNIIVKIVYALLILIIPKISRKRCLITAYCRKYEIQLSLHLKITLDLRSLKFSIREIHVFPY